MTTLVAASAGYFYNCSSIVCHGVWADETKDKQSICLPIKLGTHTLDVWSNKHY